MYLYVCAYNMCVDHKKGKTPSIKEKELPYKINRLKFLKYFASNSKKRN